MNPAEQIWRELRSTGFKNEIFHTLDDVVDRLCETICNLSNDTVKSITASDCILSVFLFGISIINQNIQNLIISQK